MKRRPFLSSCDWIARLYENAQAAASEALPAPEPLMSPVVRRVLARSLPIWQLAKSSPGHHLRAAARRHADLHDDPAFLSAVELVIREEHRHEKALGMWMDAAGIGRLRWNWVDGLFRSLRRASRNYTFWAALAVIVEPLAEIDFAALGRVTACPRLSAECRRIVRDERIHLRFHCEHLALARRRLPRALRRLLDGGEFLVCAAVSAGFWMTHGAVLRAAGGGGRRFYADVLRRFFLTRRLSDPDRYTFGVEESWRSGAPGRRRLTETAALWMR